MNNPLGSIIRASDFWLRLKSIVATSKIIIDRPRNSPHPKFPDFIYPVDYGYLKGTSSSDGSETDIWIGTSDIKEINGILCTIDPIKKDLEIKVVFACTKTELTSICKKIDKVMETIYIPANE